VLSLISTRKNKKHIFLPYGNEKINGAGYGKK